MQKHHVAVLHGGHGGLGIFAGDIIVVRENDLFAQQFGQAHGHRRKAELFFRPVFGLAQMAAQHHAAAVLDELLNGGQRGNDAVIVGDLAVLHGNVKITAHQYVFAFDPQVFHSLFAKRAHEKILPFLLFRSLVCLVC